MQWPLRLAVCMFGVMSVTGFGALAQPFPPAQLAPASAANSALSAAQLDQLTAPIALYSDPLIGQILTAATYPLEVVEAQRWLQDPANAALAGEQLAAALQQQSWDLSVKSLVPFPQILQMMDSNLEWTERIGDAFLAQQDAVMDSIQRLRKRAAAAGALTSTPQQAVSTEDQDIQIEPASPDMVYVPYYDPNVVYGPWLWPDYPPFYFLPPAGLIVGSGLWIGFGIGFPILAPFWGWDHWDWRHHRLDLVPGRARRAKRPLGARPVASSRRPLSQRVGGRPLPGPIGSRAAGRAWLPDDRRARHGGARASSGRGPARSARRNRGAEHSGSGTERSGSATERSGSPTAGV